jgi:predicted Holliday junction resolvase-like endonuclease
VEVPAIEDLESKLRFALASADSVKQVLEILEDLPGDLLQSITRSLGKRTGKLNELMATFELTKYDRLFYLGDPIDFVGIKYDEGIDFIEVKTGRFRLTEDEKKLRELIEDGRVNYVPLLVERIGIAEEVDTGE